MLVEELWRIGQAASYRTERERFVANTARQLSHGWLADASMETAKLLMRCSEAENVASDSACLAAATPWHRHLYARLHIFSAYIAVMCTAAFLCAHPLLQLLSSTSTSTHPAVATQRWSCFCCAIIGVAACDDSASMTQT